MSRREGVSDGGGFAREPRCTLHKPTGHRISESRPHYRASAFARQPVLGRLSAIVVQRACGLRCQVPIPLQGASTRMPSNLVFVASFAPPSHCSCAKIENLGPGGALLEFGEAAQRTIARPEQAFVLHQIGEMHRLAAFAGTGIPPRFAGFGRGGVSHQSAKRDPGFRIHPLEIQPCDKIGAVPVYR